jgi:DNA invertase Pin-like site-specific DNA recombinase
MRILAYLYSDPLLEPTPDPAIWGWEVDRVYQDLAVAGSARSQWQQLLVDAQTEPTDYVLVRRLEELGDSLAAVQERLAELEARAVRLIAIEQSTVAATGTALVPTVQADLLKLLQTLQHDQRSRRIRQGHARSRIQAQPPPGKAPYGYRRSKHHYTLDRTTAPVVKDFFEHFLLYGSVRGAVRFVAKQYGKKIAVSTGHRWLTNPVYRGDIAYQNGDILCDTHVPIISRDEAAQVDRLLWRNRRLSPRTASAPRSLAGLVVCAHCRSPMTISQVSQPRRNQNYLYLRPSSCPQQPKCKALTYEAVLQQTIAQICEELPRAVAEMTQPDMDGLRQGLHSAIAAKQAILAQLPALVSDGILDQATADLRAYTLRTEIAAVQGKLAQLPPVNLQAIAQTVSLAQFWLDLSEVERRFYFREFIREIEVSRQAQHWCLDLRFIF